MESEDFDRLMKQHRQTTTVPPSSTVDLKLDLLANPLKVQVVDSESSSDDLTSIVEVVDEESSAAPPPPEQPKLVVTPTTRQSTPPRNIPSRIPSPPPAKKEANEKYRKVELLRIFQELENKGVRLSTRYSINSSLEEMEQEYEILKSLETKKQTVRLYKGFMINGIQAIEMLNSNYNPFDFHLQGWAEHVSLNIDDYNDVLEELYEKWKYTGRKIEPEIKLVLMILMSATTFHATHSFLGDHPKFGTQQQPPSRPQQAAAPTPPVMKAPNPREFLDRLRKEKQQQPPPQKPIVVDPVAISEDSSATSTEFTSTTTTTRRKKPMTIRI